MDNKRTIMISLGLVAFIITVLPVINDFGIGTILGFIGIIKGSFIGVYFLSLGIFIHSESKNILKTLTYQTIPVLMLVMTLYVAVMIKINPYTSTNFEILVFLILFIFSFISPIIVLEIYKRRQCKIK